VASHQAATKTTKKAMPRPMRVAGPTGSSGRSKAVGPTGDYWMKRVSMMLAMSGTCLMMPISSTRFAASFEKAWISPAKNLRLASRSCQRR
jgi:hypothetical protein